MDAATQRWIRNAADEHAVSSGCYFDERAANRVPEFFRRFLCHSKGTKWAGRPFELQEWQALDIVLPLFGWKRADGSRRFRKTYIEIPKKNGKSTLAAGIGLYLLAGDGEPGAEVYSAASDQNQASIVHGEAINMVQASPELSKVLSVNLSTRNINFNAQRSYYRSLSADAAGKEGLNAHGIIADELHIWFGRKLWDSLKYAFRARAQGLLFVITTAGDDVQTVCFEQHEYAQGVLAGHILDDRFFAYIRAAGRDDDWLNPETWAKANPGWGSIIDPIEFAADALEASKTPSTQATFKRYSLNTWCTGTNPWLDNDMWKANGADYELESLRGRKCYGGLDLATARDLTALVLVFQDGHDAYRLVPFFWLPEDTVNDPDSPPYYRLWKEQGFLFTTPGNVTDYTFIKKHVATLSKQFKIKEIAFDPYNAEQVTQEIESECGIKRIAFGQTVGNFAAPTKEFERLVLSGGLKHNNHPVLTWQAGHVSVKTDANGNIRPVKPIHGDAKKIDGIVAGIMGLARAMLHRQKNSVYADKGMTWL